MPRPDRQEIQSSDPSLSIVLCDDGSRTLKCNHRNITWHSESGAIAESQLVFLKNSGIAERLDDPSKTSRVLEVGFGTGLNFWLTATLAIQNSTPLEYTSFEPNPLSTEVITELQYGQHESCRPAIDLFLNSQSNATINNVALKRPEQPVEHGNLKESFFDAVYHDPFGPEDAPELWTKELFAKLLAALKPDGKLVTYCVKSEIQRRLASVGFEVSKTKGPRGGKREVLVATRRPK